MAEQRTRNDYDEQEDNLVGEDLELLDSDADGETDEEAQQRDVRNARLDMRQRIEEKLEERRLMKELNEYEFFDLDEDTLH